MLEKTHERITEELRNKHMKELDQLIADHRQELIEEKEATKQGEFIFLMRFLSFFRSSLFF